MNKDDGGKEKNGMELEGAKNRINDLLRGEYDISRLDRDGVPKASRDDASLIRALQ